jgi:hypothetical protein
VQPRAPSSRLGSGIWTIGRPARLALVYWPMSHGLGACRGMDLVRGQRKALDPNEAVDGLGESRASRTGSLRGSSAVAQILRTNRRSGLERVAVLALLLPVIVIGCDQYLGSANAVGVENRTSFELHFSVLLDQDWYTPVARAHPHQSAVILGPEILPASKCTAGGMIAYDDDGREIARHDAPLCAGDRWVIDIDNPTATPVSSSGG